MKHSLFSLCMLAGMAAPCQTAMAIGGQNLATLMQQQQIEVKGTVVDNTGEPLIGVSVQIVGSHLWFARCRRRCAHHHQEGQGRQTSD